MSTTNVINSDAFIAHLKAYLNKSMTEAAEPLIQEALKQIEKEMRRKMAANLIAEIEEMVRFDVLDNRQITIMFPKLKGQS